MSRRIRLLFIVSLSLFIIFELTLDSRKPLLVSARAQMEEVEVTDDLVITHDVRLIPGEYHLQDRNRDGIIQIDGDGITVDASGVVIISDDGSGNPEGEGIGLVSNKHDDLTLLNFDIRGYRHGIEINSARNVLLDNSSVSGSLYGVRIQSAQNVLIQNSNISGNHKDITSCGLDIGLGEYYGGGILFVNVTDSIVRDNTLTNESTGLEMINCSRNQVLNNMTSSGPAGNETQQNSCWGIRLQGSTDNLLRGNIADYVDRQRYLRDPLICPCNPCDCSQSCDPSCCPVYLDSGDSAGILLVSGSNHNQVISNSMLYSGDGFFIGNSFQRASNDNYVYGNDGSFSPHNAFEATFSTGNIFDRNFANNSDYGFWLGLSDNSRVQRNLIAGNYNNGIAIEHGHDNELNHNAISRNNGAGIRLWADGGGNPSHDYHIHHNDIESNNVGLAVENTAGVYASRNQLRSNNSRNVQTTNVSAPTDISHNNLQCENSVTASDNLAYGKSATASVDSGTAARAVDGVVFSENHSWSPGHVEAGQYWQVNLGDIYNISEIVIFPYYGNLHDFPYSYHINVATDKTCSAWSATPVVTELNRVHRQETIYDFPQTPARCLRLVSDDPTREWIQMSEFAVYASTGHYPVDCRYAFDNTTTPSISAPRNWWGTTDTAQIMQLILGQVTYTPFLLEPIPSSSGADGARLDGWATTTPLPQAEAAPFLDNGVIRGQQLIFYNNRVYVFGGQKAGNALLQDVYYNFIRPDGTLRPNGWTSATPLPGAFYDQAVVRVGNHVYLITGAAGATAVYYATLQADGSLGAWTATASLNPSRQSFAAVAYGKYIYAAGGNSGGMRDFVKFTSVNPDGSLNAWADTTALPEAMQAHTLAAYDDFLYFIAPSGQIRFASINSNDGTLGAWQTTTALPQALSSYATFEHDGSLYVLGGNSTTVYYATIMSDGTLGAWQTTAALPEQLRGLRVGASDGYVYAIGGFDGTTYRNTVSYARLEVPGGCDGGENLTAQFNGGVYAVTSALTYRGLDTVTVSGVGQASGGDYSDAFYIFADGNGNPVTPWHPTGQYNWLLTINGAHPEDLIRDHQIPAYRPDHRYTFQIVAPAGALTFGVGDAYTPDNTGSYAIGLCGGTP
ncbi:MAG: right-handed parallel beta-helix repeat-containing protein [Acidobacteria bacterium]|nr:right-handed parallel beta-helix repeat-containing protein [Acidobacteriota bacterium]